MLLEPGARVDRYVVEGLLGAGGMAEVYAVRHVTLGSRAALKVLRLRSPVLAERMTREGRAQAQLRHPNVVAVLDLVDVDGSPGLVMERVDGPTLADVLAEGPVSMPRFERLARGLLLGLGAAHRLGIVHRDLKPANVLVARGDVVRIADFGLATALGDEQDAGLTHPGTTLGTPAYMSPEQHRDAHAVDARSDLFSLGVVLYEMVVGAAPAAGANVIGAWQRMSGKQWATPREVDPSLPQRIDDAIRWALEPVASERVPTIEALWDALFGEPFPADAAPVLTAGPTIAPARIGSPTPVGSLPQPSRELVGREAEVDELLDRLDARGGWVTLVGTPGAGKTRVAIECATRWRARGKHVWWIDLQSAVHETDVLQTIAWALDDGTEPTTSWIGRSLARRVGALVVLDNLEQLPRSVGGVIASFLRAAPSIRLLATSRQPVGVGEEQVVELHPFEVPADPAAVLGSEAWRLLTAAARADLGPVDPAQAQRVLRALDGLPLAIELAAARLEVLDLHELERRLADPFAVLSSPGMRGERHGALWDALEWSWSMLTDDERRTLAQVSVFRSPFTLASAEGVVRGLDPRTGVLDAIHGLVRRNLVRRSGSQLSMLRSVAEFAHRQLESQGPEPVYVAHAEWVANRAAAAVGVRIRDAAGLRALEDLAPELEAALERVASLAPRVALRVAWVLAALHERRSPPTATLRVCAVAESIPVAAGERALELDQIRVMRAFALRQVGASAEGIGQLEALLAQPIAPVVRSVALASLADLHSERGDDRTAGALLRQALELAKVHGPPHVVSTVAAAMYMGITLTGEAGGEEMGALAVSALPPGDQFAELAVHKALGWIGLQQHDLDAAKASYLRVRELAIELQSQRTVATSAGQLGLIAESRGELTDAAELYDAALDSLRMLGDPIYLAYYTGFRGRVRVRRGEVEGGVADLRASLAVSGLDPRVRDHLVRALGYTVASVGDPPGELDLDGGAAKVRAAVLAVRAGDRAGAAAALAELPALDPYEATTQLVRGLVERVQAAIGAWRVSYDGTRVEEPGGATLSFARHPANARILARLALEREQSPGATLGAEALAEAGWPGERIVPAAAANRVRVALSALRREGLGALIQRDEGGWRLDPTCALERFTST